MSNGAKNLEVAEQPQRKLRRQTTAEAIQTLQEHIWSMSKKIDKMLEQQTALDERVDELAEEVNEYRNAVDGSY